VRTDPFRELDRLTQHVLGTAARPAAMPMDACRARGTPRCPETGLCAGHPRLSAGRRASQRTPAGSHPSCCPPTTRPRRPAFTTPQAPRLITSSAWRRTLGDGC